MDKKIVIDARESGTSTGRYVDKLVEYLHQAGPKHRIVVLAKSARIEYLKSIAPNFEIIESNYKEFSFGEQIGLARQLRALKPDLVHFAMDRQPILYRGRVIATMHDLTTARFTNPSKNWLVFKFKQLVYRLVLKDVARKSVAVITPSKYVKQDVAQYTHIDPGKITVTYEAADKITAAPIPIYKLQSTNYLLYVGRPLPHKNLKRLIEAFAQIQTTHPDLQLVLAGKKDVLYDQIQTWIEKEATKNVTFTGFVSEGQLRWLYENTAAYVFPSLSEGFGLPGVEAMVHGAPVVSSNTTCLPEVYGQAAHYFDPLDVRDMATKINDVVSDPKLRARLVEAGKTQAAKYSWAHMAAQTLDVYNSVLDNIS